MTKLLLLYFLFLYFQFISSSPKLKLELGEKGQYKFLISGLVATDSNHFFASKSNSINIRPLFSYPEDVTLTMNIWANQGGKWQRLGTQEFSWKNDHQMTIKRIEFLNWRQLASVRTGEIRLEFIHGLSQTGSVVSFFASNKGSKKAAEEQIFKKLKNTVPHEIAEQPVLETLEDDVYLDRVLELIDFDQMEPFDFDQEGDSFQGLLPAADYLKTELEDFMPPTKKRRLDISDEPSQPCLKEAYIDEPEQIGNGKEEETQTEEKEEVVQPTEGKEEVVDDTNELNYEDLFIDEFNEVPTFYLEIPQPEMPDLTGYFIFSGGLFGQAVPYSILLLLHLWFGFSFPKRKNRTELLTENLLDGDEDILVSSEEDEDLLMDCYWQKLDSFFSPSFSTSN